MVCLFFYKKLSIYFVVSATLSIFAAKIKAMINKQLLQPESIVIIGGSNNYHKPGGAIVRNILNGGYKGTLRIVNPKEDEIANVVRLQINAVRRMLEPQGFQLNVTDAAIDALATEGYDPEFGARPVKRAIQRCILNDLSRKLLSEEVSREKPITIDAAEGRLVFRN